jgi:hypothetical protein
MTQPRGFPGNFLLFSLVQERPATEVPNSRSESAQKTTTEGTIWEIFGFDWGRLANCTGIFPGGGSGKEGFTRAGNAV